MNVVAQLRSRFRRWPVVGYAGLVLVVSLILAAVVVPEIGPDATQQRLTEALESPSPHHPLGTDHLGRDQLRRIGEATQNSALTVVVVLAVSGIGGGLLGIFSGLRGGTFDLVLQRAVDAILAMPLVVLVLAVVTAAGASFWSVALSIGIAFSPLTVRVARSSTLTLRSSNFLASARVSGASTTRIVVRHLVPNALAPWAIVAAGQAGAAVLVEAALAFLGFAPGRLTLGGLMGGEAQIYMYGAPWLILWPGVVLALLALSVNLIGEWASESTTPRSVV